MGNGIWARVDGNWSDGRWLMAYGGWAGGQPFGACAQATGDGPWALAKTRTARLILLAHLCDVVGTRPRRGQIVAPHRSRGRLDVRIDCAYTHYPRTTPWAIGVSNEKLPRNDGERALKKGEGELQMGIWQMGIWHMADGTWQMANGRRNGHWRAEHEPCEIFIGKRIPEAGHGQSALSAWRCACLCVVAGARLSRG